VSKPIHKLVDDLPTNNITVSCCERWILSLPVSKTVGFENTIRTVTGETDESLIQQIGERAIYLYNDRFGINEQCGSTKPLTDAALGAAAWLTKSVRGWLVGF